MRRNASPGPSDLSRRQSTNSNSSSSSSSSSPASGSLNSTRVVLGRGFANGQLTYNVPVTIASQELNVQLDTGSGDLWFANQDCTSDSCKGHQGLTVVKLNDNPDSIVDQDTPFDITYLLGTATGSVKTSSMLFGDPNLSRVIVNSQAFGSCSAVSNEDMDSGNYSGILGLGPPANSLIQASMNDTSNTAVLNIGVNPPETGAVLAGFWNNARPGRRFVGIGLQRLEEEGGSGDSLLTVGNHEPAYAGDDLTQIAYTNVVSDAGGVARHWRVQLTSLSVQLQHDVTESIPVGTSSVITGQYPIAVFDSGASVNLGPETTLNALYGAWGIGPASDGGYYVPCDLQLNITVGFGGINIPIHPLDASLYASSGIGTSTDNTACIGSFQALRSLSGASTGSNLNASFLPADFVLSPAFMRSVYTVLSCDGGHNTTVAAAMGMTTGSPCQAAVGMRSLVNLTSATQQFTQVRIKKQSLGQSGLTNGSSGSGSSGSKGLSGGIKVVIGCVSAIVVIAVLFGVALWRLRKRRRRMAAARAAAAANPSSEKPAERRMHSKKLSNAFSLIRMDTLALPVHHLDKDDDSSSQGIISPAQRAKARQVHHMHGVFDDDELADEEVGRGVGPQWGEEARPDPRHLQAALSWDLSSTGYADARQVKNAYLASLTPDERHAFLHAKGKETEQHPLTDEHVSFSQQSPSGDVANSDSSHVQVPPRNDTSSPSPLLQNHVHY